MRELQNVLERAAIVAAGPSISAGDLDFGARAPGIRPAGQPAVASVPAGLPLRARLQEEEKASIVRAVEGSGGNIAAAARALGVNRSTLYFRIKKFELEHLLPTRPLGEP